jgi:hypothetical protein
VFVKLAGVGDTATMPNIKDHYTKYTRTPTPEIFTI